MATNYALTQNQNRAGISRSFVYDAGDACESILLPIVDTIGVQLSFDVAGTAKIQGTVAPYNDIEAGTALWLDWDLGDVTTTSQANGHKISAIRVYRTSGTVRLTVTL